MTYDGIGRLASLSHDFTGTANDVATTFSYNPASQITQAVRNNDAFAWSGHGSGSTATVTDGLNRLATVGGVAATHDANYGNYGDSRLNALKCGLPLTGFPAAATRARVTAARLGRMRSWPASPAW